VPPANPVYDQGRLCLDFTSALIRYHFHFTTASGSGLRLHPLPTNERSFLTLLGVIIGVASVVMVGAAISGLGALCLRRARSKVFGSKTYLIAQVASAVGRKEFFEKLKRNRPSPRGRAVFAGRHRRPDPLQPL